MAGRARSTTSFAACIRGRTPSRFSGRSDSSSTDPARRADPAGAAPGTILDAAGDRLRVATGDGVIDVLEIQTEGKRPMPVREFLAGHPLAAGAILHAPA